VESEASIQAAYDTAERVFGTVDTVIANAGLNAQGPALELDSEGLAQLLRVNVQGVYLTAREAARRLIASSAPERGRIVLVGSVGTFKPLPGLTAYSLSKAAVGMMGKGFAREWARHGIVTNCYCPAAAGHREAPPAGDLRADAWDAMYRNHPMQRDGDPEEDIAPVVLFLCSPAAQWLNGETLMLDGGGYMTA